MAGSVCQAEAFAVCHTCRLRHPCFTLQGYLDFLERHQGHATSYLNRDWLHDAHRSSLAAWDPRKLIRSVFGWRETVALRRAVRAYDGNADIKAAYQSAQTMTVTNLHSLGSSATAGWQSAVVDNTSNLYLDDLWQFVFDFANTAPANSKGCYLFAYHGLETTYTNPASGSEGTITLLDVTANAQAMPSLGFVPYTTQDEVAESRICSMAATAAGILPQKTGVAVMNHSGAALAASGNVIKHTGVYATSV